MDKARNRYYWELSKDDPITVENVKYRGERTAICAVKSILCKIGDPFMRKTYYGLLDDINNFDADGYNLTEAYDIAQEAISFFCGHIGKTLNDLIPDAYGNQVTVLKACFRVVNAYIMRCQRKACKTVIIDDLPKHQITVDFDWGLETEDDYTVVDERIKVMNLTARQDEILQCMVSGRSTHETARALSVVGSTIRQALKYIRLKYIKHLGMPILSNR